MKGLRLFLLMVLMSAPTAVSAADPAAARQLQELQGALAALQTRLDALVKQGDAARQSEIDALRRLLADADQRIGALEAGLPAASAPAAAADKAAPPSGGAADAAAAVTASPAALAGDRPAGPDPTRPSLDWYGSLRVRAGIASNGQTEIADRFSRLGLNGRVPLADGYAFFGQLELGVNVVNQNPEIVVSGDSGMAYGEGSEAVKSRIGRVGVETPFGTFSWGKQYSPYYDVAGLTDMFFTFGSEASGAFGTDDGGISGTGRSEQAFQYRHRFGPVHVGAQVQNRTWTDENASFADTYGFMAGLDVTSSLTVAAAFNQVRDGVDKPKLNQPKRGDQAFIVGGRWSHGPFQVAADYAASLNHEVDDQDVYFNGRGVELYSQYDVGSKWSFGGGFNYLWSAGGHPGEYRRLNGLGSVTFHFNQTLDVNAEIKIEGSRATDGSALRHSVLAWGVNYYF
ncbi:MAG TPA: porin [Acidobacteriota bacterium]|nr:porin [Acidobacteriota bacterium]